MAVLYSLAAITPDTEFGLSFYDYFTEEERFALWRVANLREYRPAAGCRSTWPSR